MVLEQSETETRLWAAVATARVFSQARRIPSTMRGFLGRKPERRSGVVVGR